MVCPRCWGTTVSPEALAKAKAELERLRAAYKAKREANRSLRGRSRGMAGRELTQIGDVGRALRTEVDRIERQISVNRAMARMLVAAVNGETDG